MAEDVKKMGDAEESYLKVKRKETAQRQKELERRAKDEERRAKDEQKRLLDEQKAEERRKQKEEQQRQKEEQQKLKEELRKQKEEQRAEEKKAKKRRHDEVPTHPGDELRPNSVKKPKDDDTPGSGPESDDPKKDPASVFAVSSLRQIRRR